MPTMATSRSRAETGYEAVIGRRAWVEQVMGLPVSVHVRAADPDRPDIAAAVAAVFTHLRRVDAVLSTWRADSDLLRLQHHEIDPGQAHPWLSDVVELCLLAEERTDGLFRAWRTGAGGTRELFDPTGLVKGWAVSGASAHLETVPEIGWCIGAGGDLSVGLGRGMLTVAPTWRIGIEDPSDRHQVAGVVTVSRGGVATSGAAARGAHVIDPRTRRWVERAGSVTVTGPDLLWADVWATAAWVDPALASALLAARDPAYTVLVL